jgi:hypothetical protein
MAQPQQIPTTMPPRRAAQVIVIGGAGLGVVALLGSLVLWFHYGTAVFFETLVAGISACF